MSCQVNNHSVQICVELVFLPQVCTPPQLLLCLPALAESAGLQQIQCVHRSKHSYSQLEIGSDIHRKLAVGFEGPGMFVVGAADPDSTQAGPSPASHEPRVLRSSAWRRSCPIYMYESFPREPQLTGVPEGTREHGALGALSCLRAIWL